MTIGQLSKAYVPYKVTNEFWRNLFGQFTKRISLRAALDLWASSALTLQQATTTAPFTTVATAIGKSSAPVASAVLESVSTTQGWLPPRMTTTQRDAISSPAEGLIVYNTTTHKLNVRAAAAWEAITSA